MSGTGSDCDAVNGCRAFDCAHRRLRASSIYFLCKLSCFFFCVAVATLGVEKCRTTSHFAVSMASRVQMQCAHKYSTSR